MQNTTIVTALVALLFSASSLAVSVLNYRRDRSKVRAWSTLEWIGGLDQSGPVLRVRIVNEGRRPVALMSLVKKKGQAIWWRSLIRPKLSTTDAFKAIVEIERSRLAHVAALKLGEGEAFELEFRPGDSDEFLALHLEVPEYAEMLLIEDVAGKRYPVLNSAKDLKEALTEWRRIEAQDPHLNEGFEDSMTERGAPNDADEPPGQQSPSIPAVHGARTQP